MENEVFDQQPLPPWWNYHTKWDCNSGLHQNFSKIKKKTWFAHFQQKCRQSSSWNNILWHWVKSSIYIKQMQTNIWFSNTWAALIYFRNYSENNWKTIGYSFKIYRKFIQNPSLRRLTYSAQQVGKEAHTNIFEPRWKLQSMFMVQYWFQK